MSKKKNLAAKLEASLNEALSPKQRNDVQESTKNLLKSYREDSPLDLKVTGTDSKTDLDDQIFNNRTTKDTIIGRPVALELGRPSAINLDDQLNQIGRPNSSLLDDKTTKQKIWTTKSKPVLDDQTTKKIKLDDQNKEKSDKWNKYEKNRATARLGIRPNAEILKRFKKFCIDKGIDVTVGTELAWLKFMDLDDQNQNNLDDKTTFNNKELMMIFKSRPVLINLYYAYNRFFNQNVKWKAKDDQIGASYNKVDPRIVELGIIQTQCNLITEGNTNTQINGFQYYTNEINKFMQYEEQPQLLDMIIEINRKNWRTLSGKEVDLSFLEEGSEQ
ncbi:MAG: hypothetical protein ABWZ66_03150 [Pyrinomonadaceae bacterium]